MLEFYVERLAVPAQLRARHGVLTADALAVSCAAHRAAALIVQQAHEQAQAMRSDAAAQAEHAVRDEQQRVVRDASVLLAGLRASQDGLLDGVGALAIDLAARAFERLALDQAPQERIAAALRRVREEAPQRLLSAVAWFHPDDLALVDPAPWEARADARLARGSCRLEASSGEWRADFDLGAFALKDAILAHASPGAPAADQAGTEQS